MSKRHKRQPKHDRPVQGEGLWVTTEILPDTGAYAVTISMEADRSVVLDRDGAQRYATTAVAAAQRAEYDAAIFKLITQRLSLDADHAAAFLGTDIRPDRAPLDDTATAPLRFVPGCNSKGEAFIHILLDGQLWGQVDTGQLREHAMTVLEAPHAADLDAGLVQALRNIGLADSQARNAVMDIANWRDA